MIVEIFQLSFHVFVHAIRPEISSFFSKSFPFLFLFFCVVPNLVLSTWSLCSLSYPFILLGIKK